MGADIVIAVDVASSSEVPTEAPRSVADMLGRLIDLPLLRNTVESRPLANLVITPDLKGLSSGDFAKTLEIIPKGDVAAKAQSARLSQWSVSEEEYAAWQKSHRKPLPKERPILDAVVVDPIPNFDTRRITRVIATKAGLPFNERVLQADMRRISGMALWQNVEFRLETTAEGKSTLHIIATPKSWGPTYVSAGIDFEINASQADADWNLSMLVDATELNRIGADWKTGLRLGTDIGLASKYYQPLDYTGRFFVAPTLFFDQQKIDVFSDEVDVASYRVRQGYAGLDLGLQLGHLLSLGQFSAGIDRGIQKAHRIVGLEEFPDVDADTGGFHSELILDQLDNFWFPNKGWFVDLAYQGNRTGLGADTAFNRIQLQALGVRSFNRWTVTGRIGYGDSFGSPLPLGSLFSLGGFRNLSGRPKGQLIGSTMAIGVLQVRYRLTPLPGTVVKGLYVGATAELGNVWTSREDASFDNMHGAWSVYVTSDTLLGPLYLAYGNSGNKNTAIYLFLNRGF
jgi:NTE family protein